MSKVCVYRYDRRKYTIYTLNASKLLYLDSPTLTAHYLKAIITHFSNIWNYILVNILELKVSSLNVSSLETSFLLSKFAIIR